jgi:uncharacterized cupredoxin-like copper-binding protein
MKRSSLRPSRSSLLLVAVPLVVALLIVGACGGGSGAATWTYAPLQPTPGGSPGESPATGSPGATGAPGSPAGTGAPSATGTSGVSPPPSGPASPGATGASGEAIDLVQTASLQIQQDGQPVTSLTVQQGQTYVFRVTNEAGLAHNFYIGPPDRLAANDVSGLPGIPDFPEGTQELEYTVTEETATLEFACTVPGHYPSMHGTFTVEP